jgi:DNA repair protein RecO (recombination protein O)
MLHSTKGIVFHSLKYSETSIIVKIYTELFGLQSYLIRGVRKSKSKVKPALFQPLTLLDLEVNHREHASLQSMREVRVALPYQTIPYDIRKSSIALFINELVYKVIREEEANPDLFEFLWHTCLSLDKAEDHIADFHIRFAIELMHYLGIFPQLNFSAQTPVFNMREGVFQAGIPAFPEYLEEERSGVFFNHLTPDLTPLPPDLTPLTPSPEGEGGGAFTKIERGWMLETVMLYYRLHLPGFRGTESQGVLKEVFG